MPSTTPLTDAINALTTYSNTVTGASDTTLSDAVATLAAGYGGGGGGGPTKLAELSVNGVRGYKVDIDASWLSYPLIILAPNLTFNVSDWLYIAADNTSGGNYTNGSWPSITPANSLVLWGLANSNGHAFRWLNTKTGQSAGTGGDKVTSYLYYYMYNAAHTMTGTITVYGVSL